RLADTTDSSSSPVATYFLDRPHARPAFQFLLGRTASAGSHRSLASMALDLSTIRTVTAGWHAAGSGICCAAHAGRRKGDGSNPDLAGACRSHGIEQLLAAIPAVCALVPGLRYRSGRDTIAHRLDAGGGLYHPPAIVDQPLVAETSRLWSV